MLSLENVVHRMKNMLRRENVTSLENELRRENVVLLRENAALRLENVRLVENARRAAAAARPAGVRDGTVAGIDSDIETLD